MKHNTFIAGKDAALDGFPPPGFDLDEQLNETRRRVYRCIDTLIQLDDIGRNCGDGLELLFDADTLATAQALLDGTQRFFAIAPPGEKLKGCALHQRLLDAYGKVRVHRVD